MAIWDSLESGRPLNIIGGIMSAIVVVGIVLGVLICIFGEFK